MRLWQPSAIVLPMRWPFARTRIPPALLTRTLQGEPQDLGSKGGSRYRGIWAGFESEVAVERFVHRQFLENARAYAASHGKGGARTEVFERMLAALGIDPSCISSILELGAGHGNSVASLRALCPHADIIASDVSPEMLALLRHRWKRDARVIPFQCDAERPPFHDASFDLIVAWGVLHHLYRPDDTIAACARMLTPGGAAILTEPMESGHRALTDLYRRLLADERYAEIDPRAQHHFQFDSLQYLYRRLPEKTSPVFESLEDKWVFADDYFPCLAEAHGLTCTMMPNRMTCASKIAHNLRILGMTEAALPQWAWEMVRETDAAQTEPPAVSAFILLRRPS